MLVQDFMKQSAAVRGLSRWQCLNVETYYASLSWALGIIIYTEKSAKKYSNTYCSYKTYSDSDNFTVVRWMTVDEISCTSLMYL